MNVEQFFRSIETFKDFKFRMISENANDIIVVIDENSNIEYINEEVSVEKLGITLRDLQKQKFDLFFDEERKSAYQYLNELFEKQKGSFMIRIKKFQGLEYLWFDVSGKVYIENDVKKAVIIARDITDKKEAEDHLERAYNILNILKDVVTHDVNNLFQNIYASSEIIEFLLQNDPDTIDIRDILKTLEAIKVQVNRGHKLLSDVKKISDVNQSQFTLDKINVIEIIEKAIEFVKKSYLEIDLSINFNSPSKELFTKGNDLLLDVFENVLINAIKHNESEKVCIEIQIHVENQEIHIIIIDNGIGIPDKMKKTIFVGNTSENLHGHEIKSLGIGLSLVRSIIEKSDGKVWVEDKVENKPSKGSKFIISLPLVKA